MRRSGTYPGGVWPVMLTPFTRKGEIDEEGLIALTEWYIAKGVSGLFAACQSSEISFLTLEERVRITEITLRAAKGRVPVVASGHCSDALSLGVKELSAIGETGVDAVITISNHFCRRGEDDDVWKAGLEAVMNRLDPALKLGVYECPAPYKRLMTEDLLRYLASTGRFYFMKDTCCDADMIIRRQNAIAGTQLGLYNANAATLLDTLRAGVSGFSGVLANMYPELFVWLCEHPDHPDAGIVQAAIGTCALIERQCYPVCAKYFLAKYEGLPITTFCRTRDDRELDATARAEVDQLTLLMREVIDRYCK